MPYIKPFERWDIDAAIRPLVAAIEEAPEKSRPGYTNYAISKLLKEVYGSNLKYADYNEVIGLLECCKLEFYRDKVGPYEEVKKKEHGGV